MSINTPLLEAYKELTFSGIIEPPISSINSIAYTADGDFLFLSDEFNHRVIKTTVTGEFVLSFGARGGGAGEFWYPRGLAVAKNEDQYELIVCDAWNHRIQKFDMNGNFIGSYGQIGDGIDEFNEPMKIINDFDGYIWVLDRGNHRLKKLSIDGKALSVIGGNSQEEGMEIQNSVIEMLLENNTKRYCGLNYPMDFISLEDRSFIVADTGSRRLIQINSDGVVLKQINLDVEGFPPYCYPETLADLGDGFVLVFCTDRHLRIINIDNPFNDSELDIIGAVIQNNGDCVVEVGENVKNSAFIVNSGNGIKYYKVNKEELKISSSILSIPSEELLSNLPNFWTHKDGKLWDIYIESADLSSQFLKQFIEFCISSAKVAANVLNDAEGALCENVARYYEIYEIYKKAHSESVVPNEIQYEARRVNLLIGGAQSRRNKARLALLEDVVRICRLLSDKTAVKNLSNERIAFIKILNSELNNKKKDYEAVTDWIRNCFVDPSEINLKAATHAFVALVFLIDHLDYLKRALSQIDDSFEAPVLLNENIYRVTLKGYIADAKSIANNINFIVGIMAQKLGFEEVGCELLKGLFFVGAEHLFFNESFTYLCHLEMKYGGATPELISKLNDMAETVETIEQATHVIDLFIYIGDNNNAQRLADAFETRFGVENASNDISQITIRKDFAAISCSLYNGQTVGGLASGRFSHRGITKLRYVKSLQFIDPLHGSTISPRHVMPISKTKLIVNDTNSRRIYLYEEENGKFKCRLLNKNRAIFANSIFGLENGGVIALEFANLTVPIAPPDKKENCKFIQLDIAGDVNGGMHKIVEYDFDLVPFIVTSNEKSVVVYDYHNNKISVLDNKLTEIQTIITPVKIEDISLNNEYLYGSSVENDQVYKLNIESGESKLIDIATLKSPSCAASDAENRLYACCENGLHIYNSSNEAMSNVTSVHDNGKIYNLQTRGCYNMSIGREVLGGNIIFADFINQAMHIFNI